MPTWNPKAAWDCNAPNAAIAIEVCPYCPLPGRRIGMTAFRLEVAVRMAFKMRVFRLLVPIAVAAFAQTAVAANGLFIAPSSEALASANDRSTGVLVQGIKVEDLSSLHLGTDVEPADFAAGRNVVVGRRVADALAIDVGDQIRLIDPTGTATPFGVPPRVMIYNVAAIIEMAPFAEATITVYVSPKAFEKLSGGTP
ncbi:hypothetical protein [Rhizobium leguminosarum]|uniref:hypothetical protein n=1 Tax=Rhizobium leguminosarum TaxID=384 RepID=UPI00144220FB|nr:hypothetical protein [Rhizobium leguminosarum]NKL79570.1 hypothetical protein [Rhizobium leguminosarum bv. viciae]